MLSRIGLLAAGASSRVDIRKRGMSYSLERRNDRRNTPVVCCVVRPDSELIDGIRRDYRSPARLAIDSMRWGVSFINPANWPITM